MAHPAVSLDRDGTIIEGTVAEYGQHCDCRKPACGLIARAARKLGLDPRQSVLVGDTWTDTAAERDGRPCGACRPSGRRQLDTN
jgi:histidinol phosphatase-like enzyme